MGVVRLSKPGELRLNQLKEITGQTKRKIIENMLFNNIVFISNKKIKNVKK